MGAAAFFARGLAVLALVLVAVFLGVAVFLVADLVPVAFFGAAEAFFVAVAAFGLASLASLGSFFVAAALGAVGLASFLASFTGPEGPASQGQRMLFFQGPPNPAL